MYVTGRVVLDGGGFPPDTVAIQRVCVGSAEIKGYTDHKGRFSVDLKRSARMSFDAGTSEVEYQANSTLPPGGLDGCEIRARLQGFRSNSISLTGRRMMDHPDIGVLVLHRLSHVEGSSISATSALAPAPARKAYNKAQDALKKGKLPDAEKAFEEVVSIYPKHAPAWFELGRLRQARQNDEGARDAFLRAIDSDAKYVPPYVALARRAIGRKEWEDAIRWSDRALRLDPVTLPDAWLLSALGNLSAGNLEQAERSVGELLQSDGGAMPKAEELAGLIYTQRRNWPEAAKHLRRFIELSGPGAEQDFARRLLAEAERNSASAVGPVKQ